MRRMNIVIGGVRIGPRDHHHAELPTAGNEVAERIGTSEPLAAMMERNIRRVICDASSGAQADGVRAGSFEIVEPELKIELSGIVLDKCQLSPAHRFVAPAGSP